MKLHLVSTVKTKTRLKNEATLFFLASQSVIHALFNSVFKLSQNEFVLFHINQKSMNIFAIIYYLAINGMFLVSKCLFLKEIFMFLTLHSDIQN